MHFKQVHSTPAGHRAVRPSVRRAPWSSDGCHPSVITVLYLYKRQHQHCDNWARAACQSAQPLCNTAQPVCPPYPHPLTHPKKTRVTPRDAQLKGSGEFNRSEVSVQKIIQMISAILMTMVASAKHLSSRFFRPNTGFNREKVTNHSTEPLERTGLHPLSLLNLPEIEKSIWFMLLKYWMSRSRQSVGRMAESQGSYQSYAGGSGGAGSLTAWVQEQHHTVTAPHAAPSPPGAGVLRTQLGSIGVCHTRFQGRIRQPMAWRGAALNASDAAWRCLKDAAGIFRS